MYSKEPQAPSTPTEFLSWEEKQEGKYEYADGVITAMTGGSVRHNDIALKLFLALHPQFTSKGCKINIADVKLIINEEKYYYPDLIVTCDQDDKQANDGIRKPLLVAEVLSPGTSDKDRGEKKNNYLKMPSVREYLLIDSEQMLVEQYYKQTEKIIFYQLLEKADTLELKTTDLKIPIANLYGNA